MRPGLRFRGWLELRGERRRSRSAQPGGLPGNPGAKRGTDRVQPQRPLDRPRAQRSRPSSEAEPSRSSKPGLRQTPESGPGHQATEAAIPYSPASAAGLPAPHPPHTIYPEAFERRPATANRRFRVGQQPMAAASDGTRAHQNTEEAGTVGQKAPRREG